MRHRISWLVVATTSSVVVSFVIPLCLLVQTLAEDRAMAAADQEARNVAILVSGVSNDDQLAGLLAGISVEHEPTTSVLTPGGSQIGGGSDMATDPDVARALAGEAFRSVSGGSGRVLLPVIVSDGTAVVRSTVDGDQLRAGVTPAWIGIIGLGLLLMALATAVALRLGKRVSDPLRGVSETAHRLREGDLAARAPVVGTAETQELARALNGLAERTSELLINERAAVGDLSHRLRTPVTALRLDAEAVTDPTLSERLGEHIAVLQRTIDAIVREARRPVRTDLAASGDLAAGVAERLDFWRPLAEDQGRTLNACLEAGPLRVALADDDLRDLVDILIDNVFAHTAEGTGLTVELRTESSDGTVRRDAVLIVADEGPGFPSPGTAEQRRPGSSGLGLDIAARTATAAGGRLERDSPRRGGARVQVTLPVTEG